MEVEIRNNDINPLTGLVEHIQEKIKGVIVGQQNMIQLLLAALLADGHVLIEGVPGVAKTLTAKLLAKLVDVDFSRLQFTPDLMPSDVIGTSIFNPQTASFQFKPGPVFAHFVLIDEINRAPAKTQAALFEVMEERQVTVDGHTHRLHQAFMIIATQNPIEHEGTYRLPEAQLDRFLMKIVIGYPSLEEEAQIISMHSEQTPDDLLQSTSPILTKEILLEARKKIQQIHVTPKIVEFIAKIVWETRNDRSIYVGASPRASIALLRVGKAIAAMQGRDFVIPEDIINAAPHVLRHRISLTPEREMEGLTPDEVLKEIISRTEIPR